MAASSRVRLERGEVDGVPAYFVPTGHRTRAGLVFRVGQADEPLAWRGVTHLVEHLALFSTATFDYAFNGSVDPMLTQFVVEGTSEECAAFFRRVCDALADLPVSRAIQEREILRTEARGRTRSFTDELLIYRFGAVGYGAVGYEEFGLRWLEWRQIEEWREPRFTAANAAFWLEGLAPDRLDVRLPAGTRRAPPAATTVAALSLPGWFRRQAPDGIAVSFIGARSVSLMAAVRILERRLYARLRSELALAYQIGVGGIRLDGESMHLVVGCDALSERTNEAIEALDAELRRFADEGPTDAEVASDLEQLRRARSHPEAGLMMLQSAAERELSRNEIWDGDQLDAEEAAITAASIAEAWRTVPGSALWALPTKGEPPTDVDMVPPWSHDAASGAPFQWAGGAVKPPNKPPRLIVGDTAASLVLSPEKRVTVRYAGCAAALMWDDGSRNYIGEDGFGLNVKPWEWRDGSNAIASIDHALPPGRVVPMGAGQGPPASSKRAVAPIRPGFGLVIGGVLIVFFLFVGLVMPFTEPTPSDANAATFSCGSGSSISLLLNHDRQRDIPLLVRRECVKDAESSIEGAAVVLAVAGLGSFIWMRVWLQARARRRLRQKREIQEMQEMEEMQGVQEQVDSPTAG